MILRKYGSAATIDGVILITRGSMDFLVNPPLVTGDAQISKDGGTFANVATLPTVTPSGGTSVQVTLSATEMQAARIVVRFIDQTSPKAWEDQEIIIETYGHASAQHAFDLSVATQGVNLTQWKGGTPNDLIAGRVDANVQAAAAGLITSTVLADDAITAGKIAANAITASELDVSAVAEIQSGLATAAAVADIQTVVDAIDLALAVVDGNVDTILLRVDVAISTRLSAAGYTAPDNANIAAIKGKTDILTFTGSDIRATLDGETVSVGAIAAAVLTQIADTILRRGLAGAEVSADGDALTGRSLLGAASRLTNRSAISGVTLTIYRADDSTPLYTMTLTTDPAAEPVVQADTN